jgi:hypothetical protein
VIVGKARGIIVYIDSEIIERATKCDKKFACLTSSKHECCEICISLNDEICVLRCAALNTCNYRLNGFSDVCTCPVRVEIYNKYKK